ncbi:hypothetical protein [Candidatus Odyssella thessalonicensis]|uniref:hypothetical protein n=1 Tax=Candidatus Odyssella thessalonicensis TaxID=84647 RepID=UPI000225AF2C|nr:hypothetical protein [Candidatus Odyssella thessalonicensis]
MQSEDTNSMLKITRIIFSLVIALSIICASISAEHTASPILSDRGVVATVQDLFKRESEIKNSWTYRSLLATEIASTSLLKYSALGAWGVLGDATYRIAQHNAPTAIFKTCEVFLPAALKPAFRSLTTTAITLLHLYDCYTYPLEQALSYSFGFLGLLLADQIAAHNPLLKSHKHVYEALTYYCCRKAGWYTANNLKRTMGQLYNTLIPSLLPESSDNRTQIRAVSSRLSSFQPPLLSLTAGGIMDTTVSAEVLARDISYIETNKFNHLLDGSLDTNIIDYQRNGTCPSFPFPLPLQNNPFLSLACSTPPILAAYCDAFQEIDHVSQEIVKIILTEYSAVPDGKKFALIVGEEHDQMSHFLAFTALMKLARSLGISKLLFEAPGQHFYEALPKALNQPFVGAHLYTQKIQFADALGFEIVPIDQYDRSNKIPRGVCGAAEAVFGPVREEAMCQNMLQADDSFIALLGKHHLSFIAIHCPELLKNFAVTYISLGHLTETIREEMRQSRHCDPKLVSRFREIVKFNKDPHLHHFILRASSNIDLGLLNESQLYRLAKIIGEKEYNALVEKYLQQIQSQVSF